MHYWQSPLIDEGAFQRIVKASDLPLRAPPSTQAGVRLALNKLAINTVIRSFYKPMPITRLKSLANWEDGATPRARHNLKARLEKVEREGLGWARLPPASVADGKHLRKRLKLDIGAAENAGKGRPGRHAQRVRLERLLKCFWTLHIPQAGHTAMTADTRRRAAQFVCIFYEEVRASVMRLDIRDHQLWNRKSEVEQLSLDALEVLISRVSANRPWTSLTIWECGEIMQVPPAEKLARK